MSIFDRLKQSGMADLIRDQQMKELLTRGEFRITEEYVHREFLSSAGDEDIRDLSLRFCDGHGELSGTVKKRLLPAISFATRFGIQGVEFGRMGKRIYLQLQEVRPLDLSWVNERIIGRVPFLDYHGSLIACDLARIPRIAELLEYRVKGIKVADFLTVKELALRQGELVGRLGFCL